MRAYLTILLLILVCGCAVGPDYQRPGYPEPSTFRGEGPGIPTRPAEASFGDVKWFEVFKDDQTPETDSGLPFRKTTMSRSPPSGSWPPGSR